MNARRHQPADDEYEAARGDIGQKSGMYRLLNEGYERGNDQAIAEGVERAVSTTLRQPDSAFTVATPCWRRA